MEEELECGLEELYPEYQKAASDVYNYRMSVPVTYEQASRSAGRRYLRQKFSEIRRRITDICPGAIITASSIIGEYDVTCSMPLDGKFIYRGVILTPFNDIEKLDIARYDLPKAIKLARYSGMRLPSTFIDDFSKEITLERAKMYFGLTSDPKEAGFILPDGTMLDFSGKKFGGNSGERTIDHSEIVFAWPEDSSAITSSHANWKHILQFLNWGAVRFAMPGIHTIMLDMTRLPTVLQKRVIDNILKRNPDATLVAEIDETESYSQIVYRNFNYPFTGWYSWIHRMLAVRR